MTATNLDKLFEPGRLGRTAIRNRTVMAPMGTDYASADGYVTQRQIDYYAERAKGGVGLIMIEASCVQSPVSLSFRQIRLDDDKYIPQLARLSESIKKHGAQASIQLHHSGNSSSSAISGMTPVSPSGLPRRGYEQSRALSAVEIKVIRDCFIEAAVRCYKAGFDIVETHSAHAYLIAEFLSPFWNERRDEYGGALTNRARLLTEILQGIKEKAPELTVVCRINGAEYGTRDMVGVECGITEEDVLDTAGIIQANGADAVHVSCFGFGPGILKGMPLTHGDMLPLAATVKKVLSIPVIAVGALTPEVAEKALRDGNADFVAFGRGLLSDPYLVQKAAAGETEDAAPCISCFQCQSDLSIFVPEAKGIRCTMNIRTGREAEYPYPMPKAEKTKKVVVVGGGPAGMEAARVCALRGHEVVLFEKTAQLGGQLLLASAPPDKWRISGGVDYYKTQMQRLKVKVRLGEEADAELIRQLKPDAVIVSAGMTPVFPEIPGLSAAKAVLAGDILSGRYEAGDKVVIIGGSIVGCETAEFLAEKGRKVAVIEMLPRMAMKMLPVTRPILLFNLRAKGVELFAGVTCEQASATGVVITEKKGSERMIPADTIVIAVGGKPDRGLYDSLQGKVPEVFLVGDAVEPRRIIDAIHEGYAAAYSV